MNDARRLLLFGATGAVGSAVARRAIAGSWEVVGVTRRELPASPLAMHWRSYDPLTQEAAEALVDEAPFDAVCWAQGANGSDSLSRFDGDAHLAMYDANVMAVLKSAASLVSSNFLSDAGARLVVVSSIWQERARSDKLSYSVTKAALGGFVRSASVDLAAQGHLVNAVLPGVLETPMTRQNLSERQIDAVARMTPHARLPDLDTLAETILFLCSASNNAISGQSITVDLGMSNAVAF